MQDLEFINKKLDQKVRNKKVYNQMLSLKRAKVLELQTLPSLEGYEKTSKIDKELLNYELYYNENQNVYALIETNTGTNIQGYLLDYKDEKLVKELVDKCEYLGSTLKFQETNGYKGLGFLIIIISLVGAFFWEGSGILIITIPGTILSALYFGIGKIIKDLEEIKNRL